MFNILNYFRKPTSKRVETYSVPDWLSPFFTSTSNQDVTPRTALSVVTVSACINKIAKTVASLPFLVYSELPNGGKIRIRKHPVANCLNVSPNGRIDAFLWREYVAQQLCLWGNAFAEIETWNNGDVSLHPLPADTVEVKRLDDGSVVYKTKGNENIQIPQEKMLHFALAGDGLVGFSPVKQSKDAIGLLMAMDVYASKFFANGCTTSGVLEHPAELSPSARDNLRDAMTRGYSGDNAHKLMILDEGMKYTSIGVNPEQAQLTNARRLAIQEICRIWDVDPAMIGEHSESHYSNVEQQIANFAIHCIRPFCMRIESEINRKLFNNQDEFFCEHNMNALLRADPLTRAQIAQIALTTGYMTVNEVREIECLNPLEESDGDTEDDIPSIGENPPEGTTPPVEIEDMPPTVESSDTKRAAIDLLIHEVRRLLRRETEFALKAAQKPTQFMEAIENFSMKQSEIAQQNLDPAIKLLGTLGVEYPDLPKILVESAKSELFDVAGRATADKLPEAIEAWAANRGQIIDTIQKRLSI